MTEPLIRVDGLRKPPSTSELIDWVSALRHSGMDPAKLLGAGLPFIGTLLKKEQDIDTAQRRFSAAKTGGRAGH